MKTKQLTLDSVNLRNVQFVCRECRTYVGVAVQPSTSIPNQCPSCHAEWTGAVNDVYAFRQALITVLYPNPKLPFTVRFEANDDL